MNVLTKIRLINELNEKELRLGVVGSSSSWHNQYKDSAWIYAGSLPYELSEGDVICVFSQYGEIVNINLIRDKKTGKSKGFAFVCYEDQRSTVLAVDNLNGTKIKGRQLRVDHVMGYKIPKEGDDIDEMTWQIREKGVAPSVMSEYEKLEEKDENKLDVIDVSNDSEEEKPKKKKKKKDKKKLSFLKDTTKEKLHKSVKSTELHVNNERRSHKHKKSSVDRFKTTSPERTIKEHKKKYDSSSRYSDERIHDVESRHKKRSKNTFVEDNSYQKRSRRDSDS